MTSDAPQGGMSGGFAGRTRERRREEIVAATAAEVLARGWGGLRMQVVAEAVGVSRQTIYNEFTNKQGLAHALVFQMAVGYLDEQEQLVEHSADPGSALRATVWRTLELFADDTLFKSVIFGDGGDTFLPLYTSQGAPLIELVSTRMTAAFTQRWPGLEPWRLRVVIEAVTRHVISHVVLPLHAPERVADDVAELFGGYLVNGVGP